MLKLNDTSKKYVFRIIFVMILFILCLNVYTMNIDRLSFNSIITNIILCFSLIILSIFNYKYIKLNKLHFIWMLSILGIYISCINSVDFKVSIEYFIKFSTGLLIMFLLSFNIKDAYKSIKFIKIFSFVYLIFTYYQLISFNSYFSTVSNLFNPSKLEAIFNLSTYSNRYVGLGIYAGNNAFTLSIGFAIYSILIILDKRKKLVNILIALAFACGVLLSGSRIMLVNMIASILVILLVKSKGLASKVKKIMSFLVLVLIGIIIVITIVPQANLVFDRFINGTESIDNRFLLYNYAYKLFKSRMLFGTGINTFVGLTYLNPILVEKTYVHNVILQLLCETGLIGVILILIPIIYTYFITIKLIKKDIFCKKIQYFLMISLYLQTSFIIYFFTGNPIYDYNMLLTYFIINSFPIGIYTTMKLEELKKI